MTDLSTELSLPHEVQIASELPLHPLKYPETNTNPESFFTEQQQAESIDKYLKWRRDHLDKEGILEPQRADILCHSTSVEAALSASADGHLRSIRSLFGQTTSRVDRMQGGKARYISGEVEKYILQHPEVQQTVLENREKILKHVPLAEPEDHRALLQSTTFSELCETMKIVVNNRLPVSIRGEAREWLHVADFLPQEVRYQIAHGNTNLEEFVSNTLGFALKKYTPNLGYFVSKQAAVVMRADQFPLEQKYAFGGTGNFHQFSESEWEKTKERQKNKKITSKSSKSETTYNAEEGADEIDILSDSIDGTAIDITKNAVVILPNTVRKFEQELIQSCQEGKSIDILNAENIYWFDETKFESVDEVVGWLMTTSEGQAVFNAKTGSISQKK